MSGTREELHHSWQELEERIVSCRLCPRLVKWAGGGGFDQAPRLSG